LNYNYFGSPIGGICWRFDSTLCIREET